MKVKYIRNIIMCMICLLLSSTFMLISRVPDEWPNWAKEPLCSIDAQCPTFSTCIDGNCLPFWPSVLAENKTQCHETCRHDIQLYENHFYLQTAGHFVHFLFRDQCVVAYQHIDKAAGLSVSDYESQRYRAVLRREIVSEHWILALCKSVVAFNPVSATLRETRHKPKAPSPPKISPNKKQGNQKAIVTQKITIKNNMGFNRDEPCDIPCHYTTGSGPVDATVYELRGRRPSPGGISVYMQMEGEHYYPIDTTGWSVENTYRWSSPLLKPYFEWIHYHGKADIQSKRVAQDAIDGVSFLARNCGSHNHREQVVKDLIQIVRVDALSSCLHNHDKPIENKKLSWIQNKIKLLRAYKFHAAFENGNVRDYVTEKVYTALAAGTVPIYLGAENIDEFVPKGSIIRVDSFKDTEALAKHIQECIANETLYQSYHEWRDRPLNSEFVEKFAFTNVSTECRTCRWVYAHKHGLPWDQKSQTFSLEKSSSSTEIFERIASTNTHIAPISQPTQAVQHSSQATGGCLLAASICNQLQIGAPFGQGVNGHGGSAKHVYRGTLMGQDVVVKYPRQDGPDQQNGQKTWPAFKLFKECELMQALEKQDSRSLHCYGICFQHKLSDEDNWKRQPFIITQLAPTLKAPSSDPLSQARRFLQMAELIQRFHQFKPGAIEFFDVAWYHFSLIEGAISAIDMDDIRLWFGNKRSTGTHKTLAAFLTMFNQQALEQCGGVFRTWYHSFRAGNWNETIPNVSASLCDPL